MTKTWPKFANWSSKTEKEKNQSPDLNMTEELQRDLKRAVHQGKLTNLGGLKQRCKDDWPTFLHNDVRH